MTVSGVGCHKDYSEELSYEPRTFDLTATTSEISAAGQWTLIARRHNDWIGLADAFNPEGYGSAARRYGSRITTGDPEAGGPEALLQIDGKLVYYDVFDRRHELQIHQFIFFDFGSGILCGTGRNAARFPLDE